MKRKLAVVTTSRADYAHLRWVLRDLRDHPAFDLRTIAIGAQLSREFGRAIDEIERDGLRVDERVECLLSSDTDVGMAKTIGVATLALADLLGRLRPDLMLLIADRYELLAPASAALALRIPLAHIEGGEISEGAIDDAVRNAVTKMSHLHFTPTDAARQRVVAMGEEPWRVHRVGAPSLDYLRRGSLLTRQELERELDTEIRSQAVLVAYHPVTIARDTLREADEFYAALEDLEAQVIFCFPNADAGGRELIRRSRAFCASRPDARLFVNLNPVHYWSLLRCVAAMLGNSSSGIMETPSLELPCVNVGMRQQGRERSRNIIDVEPQREAILSGLSRALDPGFRSSLRGMSNPYGDGRAAQRIVKVLAEIALDERLLLKRAIVGVTASAGPVHASRRDSDPDRR